MVSTIAVTSSSERPRAAASRRNCEVSATAWRRPGMQSCAPLAYVSQWRAVVAARAGRSSLVALPNAPHKASTVRPFRPRHPNAVQIYLPIAEMPVSVLLILGMGAAVGFVSGLFGIGGGLLMTPLLIFLGIPPAVAVATQSAQIVASSTTSVLGALRRNALDHKLGAILVAGGFVGSALGVWFFAAARRAGQLDLVIVISYVTLFTIVGSLMLKESIREFWSRRKGGAVRLRRRAGEHAPYLGWPLRMRFQRSKLY